MSQQKPVSQKGQCPRNSQCPRNNQCFTNIQCPSNSQCTRNSQCPSNSKYPTDSTTPYADTFPDQGFQGLTSLFFLKTFFRAPQKTRKGLLFGCCLLTSARFSPLAVLFAGSFRFFFIFFCIIFLELPVPRIHFFAGCTPRWKDFLWTICIRPGQPYFFSRQECSSAVNMKPVRYGDYGQITKVQKYHILSFKKNQVSKS